ncbi:MULTISPECIES: nitrate reductase associated protein [unclassified Synechocystis]|uniref:nitrate reductase associated protein n=1 Tax=unclassified Synechocystis TaxID=2640012 RepID=UPI0003FDE638|nr:MULTISPECIES: nitrate reductase associated protein [unclassified Synechocystis]AIE75698.1 nitrate reductase associated protein [Synechocystis sp. PCC 6714]MCT0253883.1 nitrate reductase associated protein [Synechocystis sp. CS-94]
MFFQFEADFVDSLRCIPMVVRYKLDTCGVKLKLGHWHQLSLEQRQYLTEANCETPAEITQYGEKLQTWVTELTGQPASTLAVSALPDWLNPHQIPNQILTELTNKLPSVQSPGITLTQWQSLTPLQRFALIKLSPAGHENRNFLSALEEFGLTSNYP